MCWRFVRVYVISEFIHRHYFHSHITARGNISHNSSGALVALLDQAQQLNPDANPPVVALETSKKYLNFLMIETQPIETFKEFLISVSVSFTSMD